MLTILSPVAEYPFVIARPYEAISSTSDSTGTVWYNTITKTSTSTIYEPPRTVTVTRSASTDTITEFVTITQDAPTAAASWAPPSRFANLESFKLVKFANGQDNLHIQDMHSDNRTSPLDEYVDPLFSFSRNSSNTVMQIAYPKDSVNPANSPVGGVNIYATPISLDNAQSVSLEYTVFFPSNFEWVKGGKLPGLYGGHTTCSGGDDAKSCFSTRLMWRAHGAGELYLVCSNYWVNVFTIDLVD